MPRSEDGDAIASDTDGTYHSMISQGHLKIFLRSDSRPAQIAEAWQHVLIVAKSSDDQSPMLFLFVATAPCSLDQRCWQVELWLE